MTESLTGNRPDNLWCVQLTQVRLPNCDLPDIDVEYRVPNTVKSIIREAVNRKD